MARGATSARKRPAKTQAAKDQAASSRPGKPAAPPASPWEWVVAAIGAVLVLGALGYLVYFAETTPRSLPLITLEQGSVTPSGDGYLVAVTVTNEGSTTAGTVAIEGTLRRGGVAVGTATTTLDYVPRFSARQVGLIFSSDPRDGTLELRALGYAEP